MSTARPGKSRAEFWSRLGAALLFLFLMGGGVWWFAATHPLPVTTLVVAAPRQERVFARVNPFGQGLEQELIKEFCRKYGLGLSWIIFDTPEEGFEALEQGKAHVLIATGFGSRTDFADEPIVAGPVYETRPAVVLARSLRQAPRNAQDFCEHPVLLQPNPDLEALLEEHFQDMAKDGAEEAPCKPHLTLARSLEVGPLLLDLQNQPDPGYVVLERGSYMLWRPMIARLRPVLLLEGALPYRWYWNSDAPKLDERLSQFFMEKMDSGNMERMQERYHGFFPDQPELYLNLLLRDVLRTRVPRYVDRIAQAAETFDLDPLFITAVIFQESLFDPEAESWSGVRGLMQLTQRTAGLLGATDRSDPSQSIHFGSKYLRMLMDKLAPLGLDQSTLLAFVLASYNQGIGHIFDAVQMALDEGKEPRSWPVIRDILLRLEDPEVYTRTTYGKARGGEAVEYVDRVFYYYYSLRGLALVTGLEFEELAPLALLGALGPADGF